MGKSLYHNQIKSAILNQMNQQKPLQQKDIKGIIDNVRNQYLWSSKIASDELAKVISHFKSNWQEFKDQTGSISRTTDFPQFRRYQV